MTDCPSAEIRDVLPDWVHGSLRGDAAAAVADHVASCVACAREVELLRALRGALEVEPPIDLDRLAAAVTARTLGGSGRPARRRWAPVIGGLAVAASAVFGALLLRGSAEPEATAPIAAADSVGTARETLLPDNGRGAAVPPRDSGSPREEPPQPVVRLADAGLGVGGALADLNDAELEALLQRLDAIEAVPQVSPSPAITTDFEVR